MINKSVVEEWLTHDGLCAMCEAPISMSVLYTVLGVKTVCALEPNCEHLKPWIVEATVKQEDGVD